MRCPKCGELLPVNAKFCDRCGETLTQSEIAGPEQKPENVLRGILGALIGALIGGGVVILMNRWGYVASLSGLAIAYSVVHLYDLFAGRMPKKGLVICLFVMAITPYIADRIDWALLIMKDSGVLTFGEAFALVPDLIGDAIDAGEYGKHLLLLYGFAVVGAVSALKDIFKKK